MAEELQPEELPADCNFDAEWYSKEYPDVALSGLDPVRHYLKIGRRVGRQTCARVSEQKLNIRHVIAKQINLSPHDEVALLVTHAPAGRLRPHVLSYMRQLRASGLSVLLIVVVDRPLEMLDDEIAAADGIIVRDNGGYDFGAWAHGFRLFPALFHVQSLILTNDSVIPTADVAVFRSMMDRFRASRADIIGLTSNHEFGWHVQSYFLGIRRSALVSAAFRNFINNIKNINDKFEVVKLYEISFAGQMKAAGLSIEVLFHGPHSHNPTICSWKELIVQGYPFIKLMALRKDVFFVIKDKDEILKEMHEYWPEVCREAGFDVDLIYCTVKSAEIGGVPGGDSKLLVVDINKFAQ